MRGQRGLHVVKVILDVVRLQSSVRFSVDPSWVSQPWSSSALSEQRLLSKRQVAWFNDLFYCVICVVASGFSSFALALGLLCVPLA